LRDPGERRRAGGGDPRRLFRRDGPAAPARARAARALRPALPLHPINRDLLRLPFDLDRLQGLDLGWLLQLLVERLGDQNLVGAGAGAQPAGGVDGIADHGVLESAVRADVAREHLAEVDPDADAELRSPLVVPLAVELLERPEVV